MSSCQKEVEPEQDAKQEEQQQEEEEPKPEEGVTISVSIPEEFSTKISLTQDDDPDGPVHLAWEEGDVIRVASHADATTYSEFILSSGAGEKTAKFTGNISFSGPFDISYGENGPFAAEQTQSADASTGNLKHSLLLENVDKYSEVIFSDEWAAASGGGSLKQGSILRLRAQLPDGVAATVKSVSLIISEGRSIKVNITSPGDAGSDNIITVYAVLPAENLTLAADATLESIFETTGHDIYRRTLESTEVGGKTFEMGKVNAFKLDCDTVGSNVELDDFAGGSGVDGDPWLIGNLRQMTNLMNFYKNAATPADQNSFKYWFRMIDNVDISSLTWIPLNAGSPFYKAIDFDGGGYTITGLKSSSNYASFAGVLYGSIHNVTFDGATISGTTKKGVVAGFVGTSGIHASCDGVSVKNSTVSGSSFAGGFAGHVRTTESITDCTVENTTVSSTDNHVGGFTAYTDIQSPDQYEVPVRFVNCHVIDVTVNQECSDGTADVCTGGFIAFANTGAGFTDCTVKATVNATKSAMQDVGAFIGRPNYACPTFRNCSVLSGTKVTAKGAHVGGFVGYSKVSASYTDCSSAALVLNETESTGGFVGYSAGASTYTGCSASGNVTGTMQTGGFVGLAEDSGFTDSYYTGGTVTENFSSNRALAGCFCGLASTGVSLRGCYVKNAVFTSASGGYVGGFIGQVGASYTGGNNVSVTQCHVEGTSVTGGINCGGFVGVQYGDISSCYVSGGSVTAKKAHCGGFSGFVQNGDLLNCYTTTTVNGASYAQVGGFAGIVYKTSISYCYSAGTITASGSDKGAFVGLCNQQNTNPVAEISKCIGWNSSLPFCGTNNVGATLTDCYAGTEGSVSSKAQEQTWPDAVWNFSAALPSLLDKPRRINAIFMGDSITWQWAITSRSIEKSKIVIPIDPLPSYMTLSGDNVIVSFHPGFFSGNGYIDKGVSGQNTTQMLTRFQKDVVALDPVVTVIMAGTNDLAQAVSKDKILSNISAMAEMADEAGIKVVLCSVTPCNTYYKLLGSNKGEPIKALNEMIKSYAASKGFTYCDYWTHLVADDGLDLDIDYCLYDHLHPGPPGYDVMEGIIKPIIDGLL